MRKKIVSSLFLLLLVFTHNHYLEAQTKILPRLIGRAINSSILTSAVGDAMGRVTEFITSTDAIFKKYPNGIRTFDDFTPQDWASIPEKLSLNRIAPYTDDTRMAKLVLETLIDARKNNYGLNTTMESLAKAFVKDMRDTTYGWAAPFRAPGNATLRSVKELETKIKNRDTAEKTTGTVQKICNWLKSFFVSTNNQWWAVGEAQAGGCGSVMHAHPFGYLFADNPEKAKVWAAEHSKLTHGHPMAIAACAAMATGIAQIVYSHLTDDQSVIENMIKAAQEYHPPTAQKMREAFELAKKAKEKLAAFNNLQEALADKKFRAFHDTVFNKFQGWAADDAIAASVYVLALFPRDIESALYVSIHTPGDSDSIGAMAGALVGAQLGIDQVPEFFYQVEDAKELIKLGWNIIGMGTYGK